MIDSSARPRSTLWKAERLVLASKSKGRAGILAAAGIPFDVITADVDERQIERQFEGSPAELAQALALEKARAVSQTCPGRLVLAGDQVLALDREVFHKAGTHEAAVAQLARLSGRDHSLHSALALVRDGDILFRNVSTVVVHMTSLPTAALAAYAEAAGDRMLDTVGGYEIEGLGANLIERIDGDFFTVVGLPLLPFLTYCRRAGLIAGWEDAT
jgi:septum formation protein